MRKGTFCLVAALVCLFTFEPAGSACAAQHGASDMAGGYGWQVLENVLPVWQPPAEARGAVLVAVRIGSNGEVLYCETRRSSGDPMTDMAACTAVSRAGPYPPPPGSLPVEIYLALPGFSSGPAATPPGGPAATDRTGQQAFQPAPGTGSDAGPGPVPGAASGNYADVVMARIRPHLRVPADFKGEAVVAVHLRVNENGQVVSPEIVEASGATPSVTNAVLDAIDKAGTMPRPPSGPHQIILTFTVRGL